MSSWDFFKLHGCGNDFIVGSLSGFPRGLTKNLQALADLCDRHYGIGSDGLMLVDDSAGSTEKNQEIQVEMYNPDGSPMGMCGNGIRCVVRYLCETNKLQSGEFRFSVQGRHIFCSTKDSGKTVKVDMGLAVVGKAGLSLKVGDSIVNGIVVDVGNPHFVIFDAVYSKDQMNILGPLLENNSAFPNRSNIEFVRVISRNLIEVKVWERGAGWTLACGTGACASVAAGVLSGLLDAECAVDLPGGSLTVLSLPPANASYTAENRNTADYSNSVTLLGPTKLVYRGRIDLNNYQD